MADSTLTAIRTKVRRLTRSPSAAQITDAQINEYINTFVQYDMPEHLRLFTSRTNFTWYCEPYRDTYVSITAPTNPLYNFPNKYISFHEPAYIGGNPAYFSQSRSEFYSIYPLNNSVQSIGTVGDGATMAYAGTLTNVPVLRNRVLFSSIDSANLELAVRDDGNGALTGDGTGFIDYITGVYSFTFDAAPAAGQAIDSQTLPYVPARPTAILYFNNEFILRPVPDQPYRIEMEAYERPTEILAGNSPDLEQWWQYIAYGAAKKIFEDRSDLESVALIMLEFKQQERLVLRRTIVQQTKERTATVYSDQTSLGARPDNFGSF